MTFQGPAGYRLFPVIMAVEPHIRQTKGRDKIRALRRLARDAVQYAAFFSGYPLLRDFQKNEQGQPLPVNGLYWSLSHKTEYVAGVVSKRKIGIDIEKIRSCSRSLYAKIADQNEWELCRATESIADTVAFFRYWTAKEAVLKVEGVGLSGLGKCRIEKNIDERHLVVSYLARKWSVEQYFFDDHVASIVVCAGNMVNWQIVDTHNRFYIK